MPRESNAPEVLEDGSRRPGFTFSKAQRARIIGLQSISCLEPARLSELIARLEYHIGEARAAIAFHKTALTPRDVKRQLDAAQKGSLAIYEALGQLGVAGLPPPPLEQREDDFDQLIARNFVELNVKQSDPALVDLVAELREHTAPMAELRTLLAAISLALRNASWFDEQDLSVAAGSLESLLPVLAHRRGDRNYGRRYLADNCITLFEEFTGQAATRRVGVERGNEYGPFYEFAEAVFKAFDPEGTVPVAILRERLARKNQPTPERRRMDKLGPGTSAEDPLAP